MYRCKVSQVFLQLVVAPSNLDELLIGRYKVLEAEQYDVLREYGPSTGDVQKIDPTIVLVIHTCRRHRKWQSKSPSKLLLKIPLLSQRVTTTKRKDSIYLALINVHINRYITTDKQPVNPRMCGCPVTSLGNKFKISTKLVSDQF